MLAIDFENIQQRQAGRILFWLGWTCTEIAAVYNRPVSTVHSWKDADGWKETAPVKKVNAALELRYIQLVMKTEKSGGDFKEIDLLGRQLERMSRVGKYLATGKESDLNPNINNRNAKPKKKPKKNYFSPEAVARVNELFKDNLFGYQKIWHEAGLQHRIRNLLKSRQIGATWYFGREALDDGLATGRNQIFLSASKAQAHVFREYVQQIAGEADVEVSGDPFHICTDDHEFSMYFLGTNSRTAQSYHGNLYLDEYFWIHKFLDLRKVASGMSMHKKWRQTYFSTPSAISHDAYPFWNGQLFNRGRKKTEHIEIDISHDNLSHGKLCADGQWKQIVNINDAVEGGCDLFDIDQLRTEYSPDEFANLLMCEFVDDSHAVFKLADMMGCHVDSWVVWSDFRPFAIKPLGNRPVWIGYDPSGGGDSQALAVIAPPIVAGGKFRLVERLRWHGDDFAAQAKSIKDMTTKYNVAYIGIDASGLGVGVYQLVKQFFPAVRAFKYSPELKTGLVLKAQDVIRNRRLEYDAGWNDVTQSFMAIRKELTTNQRQTTYKAGRSEAVGHADIAWAVMQALYNEPLEGETQLNHSIVEIC